LTIRAVRLDRRNEVVDEGPRYYVTADRFGWSVRDREHGDCPNHARVAYIPANAFRSMDAAKCAAETMADKLNAEGP